MKEAADGLAPHPLMYEALAATLSRKKTVGQPVKNRIQSFVARRTGKTTISYTRCSGNARRLSIGESGAFSPKHCASWPPGETNTPPMLAQQSVPGSNAPSVETFQVAQRDRDMDTGLD